MHYITQQVDTHNSGNSSASMYALKCRIESLDGKTTGTSKRPRNTLLD